MFKNVATKVALFAFDTTTGIGKTGDAANLTAYVSKDYGAVTVLADTSATEIDATNAKGWYLFDLAQAESNGDDLLFTGKSSTANVALVGRPIATTPAAFTSQVAQTGDSFARLGAPAGASVSADIATKMATYTQPTGFLAATFPSDPADQSLVIAATDAVMARLGAPAGASMSADMAAVKADTAATLADTNELQTDWVNGGRLDLILDARASQASVDTIDGIVDDILVDTAAIALSIPTAVQNADALLDRNMATGTDSGSSTVRTPRQAFRILRNAWTITGTTQSIKKEDDSTESWTQELGSTAGADPVTSTNPAGP